ncbi:hypothetical protein TNCT_375521 [Trichonephila clavata]|uniref:Uncharacterized protein n=1 Tax=Trichonephila clavata TaxID=2740835 RepID=A0A8X6H9M3_TRICU|nr:hypothetical protein TNCT_375521 [Trichonephila clavata]
MRGSNLWISIVRRSREWDSKTIEGRRRLKNTVIGLICYFKTGMETRKKKLSLIFLLSTLIGRDDSTHTGRRRSFSSPNEYTSGTMDAFEQFLTL